MGFSEKYKIILSNEDLEGSDYANVIHIGYLDFSIFYGIHQAIEDSGNIYYYTTNDKFNAVYSSNDLINFGISNLIVAKTIEFLEDFYNGKFSAHRFTEFMTKRLPDQLYFIYHIHSQLELEGFTNES